MIELDEAPAYLRRRGAIGAASVIDGDLITKPMTRRNRNLAVARSDGPGFLLKQPEDVVAARTLQREARFYRLCEADPRAAETVRRMPRYAFFDPENDVLALRLIEDAQPLRGFFQLFPSAELPTDPSSDVGSCLGQLHRTFRGRLAEPDLSWLAGEVPWILQLHEPSLDHLRTITSSNYKLLHIIQTQPGLSARLQRLRPQWRDETVIHGDVKSDNILVAASKGDARTPLGVSLVDWELVQTGDPAWDVAGMLQDFIAFWVLSMPAEGELSAMQGGAQYPFDHLQPSIRAFWRAYRASNGLSRQDNNALLWRAVRYSAARLVQSAFEICSGFGYSLTRPVVLLLQLSANILDDPARIQVQLYGLQDEL